MDDRSAVRALAEAAGARLLPGPFLDFLDPWGNRIEVLEYADVRFSKAPTMLRGMGLDLGKGDKARGELAAKGMPPEGWPRMRGNAWPRPEPSSRRNRAVIALP